VSGGVESARRIGLPIAITVGVIAALAVLSVLACAGYLLRWGRLRVIDDGRTLHCEAGLLTTRAMTLDLDRLRGATVAEPLLLRAVGGAELEAIMTGGHRQAKLIPQSPRGEVERVMRHLLGSARQYTAPLVMHGPIAARRRMTRAVAPVLLVAAGLLVAERLGATLPWSAWAGVAVLVAGAVALAIDRYRGLGHAVLGGDERWLITRSGSLYRDRDCVEANGIVGWTVRQTFFQRRAGVATVCAATAAGKGRYDVIDLPAAQAWELIDRVQPGAGDVWTRRT
jgi:putative membrane protein